MRKLALLLLTWTLLAVAPRADATCYNNLVWTQCPSGTIDPTLLPEGGGVANRWFTGSGEPALSANVGDLYLETAAGGGALGNVYAVGAGGAGGNWTLTGNIRGATGDNGTNGLDGAKWWNGGGPPVFSGNNGDYYLKTAEGGLGDVYQQTGTGGSWGDPVGNIRGAPGTNGTDGSKWWNGGGPPIFSANNGDYYLRTAEGGLGDLYQQTGTGGSWGDPVGNIRGATGDNGTDGAKWWNGGGPPVFSANNGDYYLKTAEGGLGDVYQQTGTGGSWGDPVGNIRGATGPSGTMYCASGCTLSTSTATSTATSVSLGGPVYISPTAPSAVGLGDFEGVYTGLGIAAAGFTPPNFTLFYTNFMNRVLNDLNKSMELPIIAVNSGSSGWGMLSGPDVIGGVLRLHSGTLGNSTVVVRQWDYASGSNLRSATPWYVATRMKIVNPAPHAVCGFVLDDGTGKDIYLGLGGWEDSVHYIVDDPKGNSGGDFRSLGVAIDGNYHYFEMWSTGDGILHARLDGLIGATVSMPFSTGGIEPGIRFGFIASSEAAGGTERELWVDDLLVMLPKAPG